MSHWRLTKRNYAPPERRNGHGRGECCIGSSRNGITHFLRGENGHGRGECCIGSSRNGITHRLRGENGHGRGQCCIGGSHNGITHNLDRHPEWNFTCQLLVPLLQCFKMLTYRFRWKLTSTNISESRETEPCCSSAYVCMFFLRG